MPLGTLQNPPPHPRWPGNRFPLNSGPATSGGRTLREKGERKLWKMQPNLPAHSLPSPFTSSATPELQAKGPQHLPRIRRGRPCPPQNPAACRACRNCPAQRCLTPGKPKGATRIDCILAPSAQAVNAGDRVQEPRLVEFSFLVTARGCLLQDPKAPVQQGHQPRPRP